MPSVAAVCDRRQIWTRLVSLRTFNIWPRNFTDFRWAKLTWNHGLNDLIITWSKITWSKIRPVETSPTLPLRRRISARIRASTRKTVIALALVVVGAQVTVTGTKNNLGDRGLSFTKEVEQPTLTAASGCSVPSFAAAVNFDVGNLPLSVTAADFNADGKLDLATANLGSHNVSVLLGNGAGGFAAAVNFGAGEGARSITTGDFNADGKIDIATANSGSTSTVSVLLGDGTGGFAAAVNLGTASAVRCVTTGDFNADGKLDLATANSASNNVSLFLGNGLGGFAAAVNFGVGFGPFSVTTGDFNADGKLDLATANTGTNNGCSVLLGNGTGGFAPAVYVGPGHRRYSITTGDFNADGKLDLATANGDSSLVNVSMLLGNGTGGFAAAMNFAAGDTPNLITTGDFNADGKLDLATANVLSNNVSVLLGNGTGGFATAVNFGTDRDPQSVVTGDFNGDGQLDLATANEFANNISVLLNSCTAIPVAKAINLSTRMRVQTGDNAGIGGFIITGHVPKRVLLRAIGPSLSGSGIANLLADPTMDLHGPAGFIAVTNNNWRETQEAEIIATGIPPTNDLESAIAVTLQPGAYTAIVKGTGDTSGVALVEVYDLNQAVASKLANLSTRALVGTQDNIVIAGFVIGTNGPNGRVIARGIGPSLTLPASTALADPTLELRDASGALVLANNNWQDDAAQAAEIAAAGLAPTNPFEAAIAATLSPGAYTALLSGGTGIGMVELYELGASPAP